MMIPSLTDPNEVLRVAGRALYGDTFEPVFGAVSAVAPSRVASIATGEPLGPSGRLKALHLPESMAVIDTQHGSIFAGNALGALYPSLTGRTGARLGLPVPTTSARRRSTIADLSISLSVHSQFAF